jgi:hypothetical protein
MTNRRLIRDLFASKVTRDIPPVVYFHEQSPERLEAEVSEYIITGGWPEGHPNHRRVPDGIHEQYVRLLRAIAEELDKPGGPELPTVWISGFYGSGKSSFAKLLGLALDGVALPKGNSLADALLRRDTSPRSDELKSAWTLLRQKIDPLAVVFDLGAVAKDNEHIHAAALRQVQLRLGYCTTEPLVADFELKLERDGEWSRFEESAQRVLGRSWTEVKDQSLAEEDFSVVMAEMYPDRYTDPMSWFTSRAGTHVRSESPEESVRAIQDMLDFRRPGATLFLIVDEVSQYVLSYRDRVDRLRAFATALGAGLRGRAWLMALGQQKLDEEADDSFLVWAKDRFPPKLRIHLAATNIRDVVHQRLLRKTPEAAAELRAQFEEHRPNLKLFAYACEDITPEEFVDVYPMLPGHIDLLLQITSALRTRSARSQGDDQAIRGLLQLLGELFRDQGLADLPIGHLVTLDQIYNVQNTALDSDIQASMARVLQQCADDESGLLVRVAKAVALLELIQESLRTDEKLVAQALYDRVDRGNHAAAISNALQELRSRGLLGYSEKLGFKIQSSAGEEWTRERREIPVARESINKLVQEGLTVLLAMPDRPRLEGRPFPLGGLFSDGRRVEDEVLQNVREEAGVWIDFRLLSSEGTAKSTWVRRSDETALKDRLIWVTGGSEQLEHLARELSRSRHMVLKYQSRKESLNPARKLLLQEEDIRSEELGKKVRDAVADAWMAGQMYFRGRNIEPQSRGSSFATALYSAAAQLLPELFPHFDGTQVQPAELLQLLEPELSGPSPKFLDPGLGILELDSGRYVPSSGGVVPRRIQEHVESEGGLAGASLLAHFGGPPFGYAAGMVQACVAGLLRGGRLRIQPEGGTEITAVRDAGVRELFEKDRNFRRASFFPAGQDDIGFQARARICRFFEESLNNPLDREDHAIADAVASRFPELADRLLEVNRRLRQLPGSPEPPDPLTRLGAVLEQCIRSARQTSPTVRLVKKHLDALRDGVRLLQMVDSELTPAVVRAIQRAKTALEVRGAQLREVERLEDDGEAVALQIREQLESEHPWRDMSALEPNVIHLEEAYIRERQGLLQWQEAQTEQARGRLRGREGFSTLTSDQSHSALRPLTLAMTDTTPDATAPSLVMLADPFLVKLRRAEETANEILDEILSGGEKPLIVKVDLRLHHREVATEEDVEGLIDEIRTRLLERIRAGERVRLL